MIINRLILSLVVLVLLGGSCRFVSPAEVAHDNTKSPIPVQTPAKKNTLDENDPRRLAGKVVHISDGDTLIVEDKSGKRTTVRMHAIDAPELSQAFGREAREKLRELISNQQVEIRENNKDQFKRIVGAVFLNGKDIGLEMVRGGYVWHFKQYEKQQTADDRRLYAEAEKAAHDARLGLWHDGNATPPQDYRRQKGTRR